jgi:hypothetical protein
VIGGAALFALLAYGQVKDEMKDDGAEKPPAHTASRPKPQKNVSRETMT